MMVSRAKYKKNRRDFKLEILSTKNFTKNYVSWLNNRNTNKYMFSKNINFTKKKIYEFIKDCFQRNNVLLFGIFYMGNHIGNIKIDFDIYNHTCKIGYLIGEKKFLGKGLGYLSVKKIISFLFKKNIRSISTDVLSKNLKSISLLKKNNFKKIYNLKNRIYFQKKTIDIIGFELINKKFHKKYYNKKLNFKNKNYKILIN